MFCQVCFHLFQCITTSAYIFDTHCWIFTEIKSSIEENFLSIHERENLALKCERKKATKFDNKLPRERYKMDHEWSASIAQQKKTKLFSISKQLIVFLLLITLLLLFRSCISCCCCCGCCWFQRSEAVRIELWKAFSYKFLVADAKLAFLK